MSDAYRHLLAVADIMFTPERLASNPFMVEALGATLRVLVSRHAAAWRALQLKQREPDPNGGPPDGGTPGASRGEGIEVAA